MVYGSCCATTVDRYTSPSFRVGDDRRQHFFDGPFVIRDRDAIFAIVKRLEDFLKALMHLQGLLERKDVAAPRFPFEPLPNEFVGAENFYPKNSNRPFRAKGLDFPAQISQMKNLVDHHGCGNAAFEETKCLREGCRVVFPPHFRRVDLAHEECRIYRLPLEFVDIQNCRT